MKKTLLLVGAALGLSYGANAQQWQQQDINLANPLRIVTDISIVNANTVWAIAINGGGTSIPNSADFVRTTNGGTSWTPGTISGLGSFTLTSISAINADTAWVTAAGGSANGARIYRTNDAGTNWIRQNTTGFSATGYANAIHFFNATDGVAMGDVSGGYTEVYTTSDGGTTWTRVPQANLPAGVPGEYSYFDAIATFGNTIWYGTSEGRILKSTDKGLNWTVATLPSPASEIENVAFSDANNGLALAYINSNEKGLFRTTDGGATWTAVASPTPFYNYDLTHIPGSANSFVTVGFIPSGSSFTTGLNFTTDGGLTWTPMAAPSGSLEAFSVNFFDQNTGWAGNYTLPDTSTTGATVGGIYKLSNILAPCSGTPTAGTIPATLQVCPGGAPTIQASGVSTGTGIAFQWQESDDNGATDPWAPAVGGSGATTGSYTLPANFTASKWYRLIVSCSASSLSDTTSAVQASFSSGAITTFPYTENFNNIAEPALPCGFTTEDANNDGFNWSSTLVPGAANDFALVYEYNSDDNTIGGDDWFFTPAITMAGLSNEYVLTFDYRAAIAAFPEGLEVRWGTAPNAASMPAANTIFTNNNITNANFVTANPTPIRPMANGTFYIGFRSISSPDQFNLYVDNLRITEQLISGVKENILSNKVSVYPNPSSGLVKVSVSEVKSNTLTAEVLNSLGQKVYATTLNNNQTKELNLSELAAGMYILQIQADGHIVNKTITIQK